MVQEQVNELENEKESKQSFLLIGLLFSVFFLPMIVIAYSYYFVLFRWKRYKPYFSTLIVITFTLLNIVIFLFAKGYLLDSWIRIYLFFCIAIGVFVGQGIIYYKARLLKTYPELTALRGWAYQFKYRENFLDRIKRKKVVENCKNGVYVSTEAAPLGVLDSPVVLDNGEEYNKIEPVYAYYTEALKTRLITGLTGSGKTITMMSLAYNDIEVNYPIIYADFKKDSYITYTLSRLAKKFNRPFYHFVSGRKGAYKNPFCSYPASYDPLSSGTSTSKADLVLNMRQWDTASDVYKGRTQSILQTIFYLLEIVDKKDLPRIPWKQGGLAQLIAALKTENLVDLIEWAKKDSYKRELSQGDKNRLAELEGLYVELTSSSRSPLREQIDGLVTICRTLMMSSYSDWLAAGETPNHIDLTKIVLSDEKPIVLFQFNPNEESDFAKYLGNILLSDLSRASAEKQRLGNKNLIGLYIDECQILDPIRLSLFSEKSRSAGFFNTFSVQSSNQISREAVKNSEDTLLSLFDTINTFIIHQGATEKTAGLLSQIVSKVDKPEYRVVGKRNSGIFSFNRKNSKNSMVNTIMQKAYKVEPHEFQDLSVPTKSNGYKAQAYYITKSSSDVHFAQETKPVAKKVWLVPNKEVLEEPTEEFKRAINNIDVQTPNKTTYQESNKITSQGNNKPTYQEDLVENYQSIDNLQESLNDSLQEKKLTRRQYQKKHYREVLDTEKKTTFDRMVMDKKKKSKEVTKGLPSLDDL